MLRTVNQKTGEIQLGTHDRLAAQRLVQIATEIRSCYRRSSHEVVTIGQRFIEAKDLLPHGAFSPWIEAEFGITERTAENFMNVARRFFNKTEIVSALPPTVLYSLAAPSTPDGAIDQVLSRLEAGEKLKPADVHQVIEGTVVKKPARPAGPRKTVEQHVAEAVQPILEEVQTTGAVSVNGESVAPTAANVAAAITEHAAEGVRSDGELLRQKLEAEQGLNPPAVRSKAIVDHISKDGRITLVSLEMCQKLHEHQRVFVIVYDQEAPKV